MAAARPFPDVTALLAQADTVWAQLDAADWLEAFAAHPRIGEQQAGRAGGASAAGREEHDDWSAREQAGVTADSRQQFAALNREYEERFGHIFIVCATGKSADEMVVLLRRRMRNNPDDELREAVEQQRQIMQLRLRRLIEDCD